MKKKRGRRGGWQGAEWEKSWREKEREKSWDDEDKEEEEVVVDSSELGSHDPSHPLPPLKHHLQFQGKLIALYVVGL